jgi:hypothetical protein
MPFRPPQSSHIAALSLLAALLMASSSASAHSPSKFDSDYDYPTAGIEQIRKQNLHYVIKYSEDDALCQPLLKFYNAHRLDRDDDNEPSMIEDQFGAELKSPGPTFLLGGTPWWHKVYPDLNIYNNGQLRTVIVNYYDGSIHRDDNFSDATSQIVIIKPGATLKTRERYFTTGGPNEGISYGDYVNFNDGPYEIYVNDESSEFEINTAYTETDHYGISLEGYELTKYPGLEQIKKEEMAQLELIHSDHNFLKDHPRNFEFIVPPLTSGNYSQHVVLKNGSVFIVARDWKRLPGSYIVVYSVEPSKHLNDMCYLELE